MSDRSKHYTSRCEDCRFYNDCPIDYECPAKASLNRLRKYDSIIMVRNGNFYALIDRDQIEDEEE